MQTHLRQPHHLFDRVIQYDVPDFQRRYVWSRDEQWEPLWNDVADLGQSLMEGEADAHFMGAVVLKPAPSPTGGFERRIVVDGQQRLTTLQLLIDAAQEVLEDRGFSLPARRLSRLVENPEDYTDGDRDKVFKVRPTLADRTAFRHAMHNDLSATEHSATRIVQAHDYFKDQVHQWLDGHGNTAEKAATALEDVLKTKLELVVIDLDGSDDAHMIFETLNARGTPLLQSDMVKNRLLHDARIARSDNDDYEQHDDGQELWPFNDDWWNAEVGRGLQRRPRIDMFLNHWLTLRNRSETRPYDEFRVFSDYVATQPSENERQRQEAARDIAKDIADLGRIYGDVENEDERRQLRGLEPDPEYWLRLKRIAPFKDRLNTMNVGVVTPLVLWFLSSDVPQTTLANCVRAIESFLVRRVVCGCSARGYGRLFVDLIEKLAASSVDTADGTIVSYLAEQTSGARRWPDDKELLERFTTAPLYRILTQRRIRMLLAGIEENLRTPKVESSDVPKRLHIEHVMPQTWYGEHWPLALDAEPAEATEYRQRAIHTIGNLTLVAQPLNSSLSNGPWSKKRKALADHSVLFLNKELTLHGPAIWDEQAIEARATWLHQQAVEIWPHAAGFDVR